MISFSDDSNALRSCEKLKRKISFTESQSFEIVPIAQSNSATIVLPLAAIIVFIIISGYLLIYNILYISISRDTQFYGQLKTIGTTKRQIKRIVRSQIFRTAVIGIPSGLIVGGIVSLGLVESIGMTKKQIRNVLLWEGVYYWSISFLLLATLGTAIYIPIYSAFRRMVPYAAFHYPVISLLVVAAIVLLVCLATPVITFMQNVKQSVVERLRQN